MRQNDGVPLPFELEQLFGEIDPSPSQTDAEIYTSAYHWLVSLFLMDSQTSPRINFPRVIPSREDGRGITQSWFTLSNLLV